MHAYSHLIDHPAALDARIAIYGRAAAADRHPRPAIHFYPTQYVASWRMKNGKEILLRPVRPDDGNLLAKFYATHCGQGSSLRYSHVKNPAAPAAQERPVLIDAVDGLTLVAEQTAPETGAHEILAVGRLSKKTPGEKAELAVVVGDPYRGQGLGAELLRRLIQVARDEKVQEIVANILAEDLEIRALAIRLGFKILASDDPAVITATLNLSDRERAMAAHAA